MCDLETMGTTAGCAIVSIGVIGFDPLAKRPDDVFHDFGFYTGVSRLSCIDAFLHEDEATRDWWRGQRAKHPKAAEAVDQYDANEGLTLSNALEAMQDYICTAATVAPKDVLFYGNGADFDNPILAVAARMVDHQFPWKWGNRCYRTLKNLHELFGEDFRAPKLTRVGQYHNALDDAKSQALHLWETVNGIRTTMEI